MLLRHIFFVIDLIVGTKISKFSLLLSYEKFEWRIPKQSYLWKYWKLNQRKRKNLDLKLSCLLLLLVAWLWKNEPILLVYQTVSKQKKENIFRVSLSLAHKFVEKYLHFLSSIIMCALCGHIWKVQTKWKIFFLL